MLMHAGDVVGPAEGAERHLAPGEVTEELFPFLVGGVLLGWSERPAAAEKGAVGVEWPPRGRQPCRPWWVLMLR